jgi:hypothetical protein
MRELDIGNGGDDLREERAIGGVLFFLKAYVLGQQMS